MGALCFFLYNTSIFLSMLHLHLYKMLNIIIDSINQLYGLSVSVPNLSVFWSKNFGFYMMNTWISLWILKISIKYILSCFPVEFKLSKQWILMLAFIIHLRLWLYTHKSVVTNFWFLNDEHKSGPTYFQRPICFQLLIFSYLLNNDYLTTFGNFIFY